MAGMTRNEALVYWQKIVERTKSIKTVDDLETEAECAKRIHRLESDYVLWFEYYFPNYAKTKCAWFHRRLAKNIITNRRIKQLAEWYRSAAKSVHIDMGIPLYLYYVKNELGFMLLVGENATKAAKLLGDVQAQIEFNPRLLKDYGSRRQQGDWAEGDFSTNDGVRFMSLGFMENPRGAREADRRPDYIVVDDVDNKRHVHNDRLLPLMLKHGFPVEGYSFEWDDAVEYTPQEQINIEQMLVNGGYDIDPKYFAEKYNIPVLGKHEIGVPATDLGRQLMAGDPDFFA